MAAPNPLISDLYNDPTQWIDPTPDAVALQATFGHAAGANRNVCRSATLALAQRSPTVLAFVIDGDDDHIYVGHSPTPFQSDPLTVSPYDGSVIVLLGDDINAATPIALPTDAFSRSAMAFAAYQVAYIRGADGHTNAVTPVFRFDPTASGTANTTDIQVRLAMPMTPAIAHTFLTASPSGIYTLLGFFDSFIAPEVDSGELARIQAVAPLALWYRAAVMNDAGGHCRVRITPVTSGLPMEQQTLTRCVTHIKTTQLARFGIGGPQLTTAAFEHGINAIRTVITETNTARLTHERERDTKSFSQVYGDSKAQIMYNLCGVADDAALPEIHKVLAKSHKSQANSILLNYIQDRALASPVPLTNGNLPVPTTKLVDEVFRNHQAGSTGLTFGQGLSPFSVVCEGHTEAMSVQNALKKAAAVESGATISLADVESLTTTDVRFPVTPQAAAEKLYGWSVLVDVFHGDTHLVAVAVREFVVAVGSALHNVYTNAGAAEVGMDMVNRVLFEAQQEYFHYVNQCARESTAARRPAAPTFLKIRTAVFTYRVSSLAMLPSHWYRLVSPVVDTGRRSGSRSLADGSGTGSGSGPVAAFNSHADVGLMKRFRDSEFSTVNAMIQGKNATVPKHNGKAVCMVWAFKGECSASCKRKDQHVKYSEATNRSLGQLLTKCGVAELSG
jgi:hypothetical protein